jgi:transcriptional regulator with XRE-family HTH domain/predicted transcriptional regulator
MAAFSPPPAAPLPDAGATPRRLLGVKLKALRSEQGLPLREVAGRAGVSVSYLSEIEKGRKYPKPEKLLDLAAALGVSYDDLVSLQVDAPLAGLKAVVESPFMRAFPFELFGIDPENVLALLSSVPEGGAALVRALFEVGRSHDVQTAPFLFAALRAYQQLHRNHFPELERAAADFRARHGWSKRDRIEPDELAAVLRKGHGLRLDFERIGETPELERLRSVLVPPMRGARGTAPTLLVNGRLLPGQQAFVLAREIGFRELGIPERPLTSSYVNPSSFGEVLGQFQASYFAGAVLMGAGRIVADLRSLFGEKTWDGGAFADLFTRYGATPEMGFYRLTELVPHHFGIGELYFLRLKNKPGSGHYALTKSLNLSSAPVPAGTTADEHYCRRWASVRALKALARRQAAGKGHSAPLVEARRVRFVGDEAGDGREVFTVAAARPQSLRRGTNAAVSLGFVMDAQFKRTVRFWNDAAVERCDVGLTCERCPIPKDECKVRAVPPAVLHRAERLERREDALAALAEEVRRESEAMSA